MILKKKPREKSINLNQFVERVKEAVKGERAAKAIQEAVELLLKNYEIDQPEDKKSI